jgi:predicted nucleic acid-binding protein
MVKALFDTNILIDFLSGVADAREEIARHEAPAISAVTWMEVMVGATPATEATLRSFLGAFDVIPIDQDVAEAAVAIRRQHRIKLPDAIILASARTRGRLLITRNSRDFDPADPGVRIPYLMS